MLVLEQQGHPRRTEHHNWSDHKHTESKIVNDKIQHDLELVLLIATALHEDSNMRSVRWRDLGPVEKKFRMKQAIAALDAMTKWEKEKNNG